MYRSSDELLAGPALAVDQDRAVRGRNRPDSMANFQHLLASSDYLILMKRLEKNLALLGICVPFGSLFRFVGPLFQSFQDELADLFLAFERLGQIPVRPVLLRVNGGLERSVSRDEDEDNIRCELLGLLEQLDPGHLRHADIRDHHIEGLFPELLQRILGRRGRGHIHPHILEILLQEFQDIGFVVHKENGRHSAQCTCALLDAGS